MYASVIGMCFAKKTNHNFVSWSFGHVKSRGLDCNYFKWPLCQRKQLLYLREACRLGIAELRLEFLDARGVCFLAFFSTTCETDVEIGR